MSVNKVILIGRLGRDPEVKQVSSSTVASFSIAVDDSYKDKNGNKIEQTEWVNIVAWGRLAEVIEKYVVKGMQVFVSGKIKTRSWDDKDGNKRYTTEVLIDQLEMLGSKHETQFPTSQPQQTQQHEPVSPSGTPMSTFEPDTDSDDLPF